MTLSEITLCLCCYVTGAAVLNQEDTMQLWMVLVKQLQFGEVVVMVVSLQEGQLHQSCMYNQEHQHVYCPMPGVVKFLLFNRSWNRSADRATFQHLKSRDLIDTDDPDALGRQTIRIPIAPKDLLCSLFEFGIESR